PAIVRDVHVRHDPVVVADHRLALVLHRATADGAVLADRVAVADREPGGLVPVLLVLRIVADGGELVDAVVLPDPRGSLDHDVARDARPRPDLDVLADHGVGADLHAFADDRGIRDDGRRMDAGGGAHRAAPGAHTMPAVTATAGPTRASQS